MNTWTIKTQSTHTIHSYFILDDKIIFAVMDDSLSTNVMKSMDGGLTREMKQQDIWSGGNLYFTTNNVGFILNYWSLYKSIEKWRTI